MSIERKCKICGRTENIRINFKDREAEKEYHSHDGCLLLEGCSPFTTNGGPGDD